MSILIKGIDMPPTVNGVKLTHELYIRSDGRVFDDEFEEVGQAIQIDLVRCGECEWSYIDERDNTLWCKVHMSHYRVNADHFCSYGERRADERINE